VSGRLVPENPDSNPLKVRGNRDSGCEGLLKSRTLCQVEQRAKVKNRVPMRKANRINAIGDPLTMTIRTHLDACRLPARSVKSHPGSMVKKLDLRHLPPNSQPVKVSAFWPQNCLSGA
jgi:hypothetical protein